MPILNFFEALWLQTLIQIIILTFETLKEWFFKKRLCTHVKKWSWSAIGLGFKGIAGSYLMWDQLTMDFVVLSILCQCLNNCKLSLARADHNIFIFSYHYCNVSVSMVLNTMLAKKTSIKILVMIGWILLINGWPHQIILSPMTH